MINKLPLVLICATIICCKQPPETKKEFIKGSYAYDSAFLAKYDSTFIELKDENGGARLMLSPTWQARVWTSTSTGMEGNSYGWINYDLLKSGVKKKQFNPVGGEERIWLGPEGGQFSIYFAPNDTFNIKKWQVPGFLDTIKWNAQVDNSAQAFLGVEAKFKNYSNTEFSIYIERRIRLLRSPETEAVIGSKIPNGVQSVSYETNNKIVNRSYPWKKETGLLSVWLLGMLTPTDSTIVIIPFHPGEGAREQITTNYFGDIPADRITITDSVVYFKCDGRYRSKLGLPPQIARGVAASFDYARNILTIISFPVDENGLYVNSKWEIQKEPYKGDVVNSYNDGPLANGEQLGPFYELESSSAGKEVKTSEWMTYSQVTSHFEGDYNGLKELAKKVLGVNLDEIKK